MAGAQPGLLVVSGPALLQAPALCLDRPLYFTGCSRPALLNKEKPDLHAGCCLQARMFTCAFPGCMIAHAPRAQFCFGRHVERVRGYMCRAVVRACIQSQGWRHVCAQLQSFSELHVMAWSLTGLLCSATAPCLLKIVYEAACGTCNLCATLPGRGRWGRPFYLPILNVLLGFDLKAATALSHTIVSTSALASTAYGLTHTSPTHPDRPLADLDLVITFVPALLFGVSFGARRRPPPTASMGIFFKFWRISKPLALPPPSGCACTPTGHLLAQNWLSRSRQRHCWA